MTTVIPRPLASTKEVAAYLGVPVGTLHNWRYHGVGPRAAKVGQQLRYRWEDVEAWLEERSGVASISR
jgi:excisionase family DNA binding protein